MVIIIKNNIIFLKPIFKEVIWGGDRLRTDFGYDIPSNTTGECWGISAHKNGDCEILNGEFTGITLSKLWEEKRELFGDVDSDVFPLLIKIIDAKADLSIQVHPDDAYARIHENGSLGKTECWYILDCKENSSLVIGHHAKNKDELKEMILNKKWKEFIQEIPVKKGDFIQIDPGTLHAIKGGIMLLETQQNSDITYRVYDYDRLSDGKPRQLHVQQSIDVIEAPSRKLEEFVCHKVISDKNVSRTLIENSFYKVSTLEVDQRATIENEAVFPCVSVISGEGTIGEEKVKKGDHLIIFANSGDVSITGNMEVIYSRVGK